MKKKNLFRLVLFFYFILTLFLGTKFVQAVDPVEELQKEIDELEEMKKMSQDATQPLEKEVKNLVNKINQAQQKIKTLKVEMADLALSIDERSVDQTEKKQALTLMIAEAYKTSLLTSPLLVLLAPEQNHDIMINLVNHQVAQKLKQEQINRLAGEIKQLNDDKKHLEETASKLVVLEKQFQEQNIFFKKEIESAKKYQAELTQKIASLTAKQQAIINERSGSTITSVGEVPSADDPKASITYKSQAPSNSFAIFSFGAYTHRNGMSQYGAKARADAGQSAEEILSAYYPSAHVKKDDEILSEIEVQGYGRMSFEDQYLQSIYEMPISWPLEALKAQAIAARTYALRYTNRGGRAICATEACQVYKNGKKGGEWEKAVQETRGWVLVDDGGQLVSTQYASTHGGYSNTSGWDTTDKSGTGNWSERAWEAKANSPWFYKAWWRQHYSASGDPCGREHPWLSQAEMADILNSWLVRKNPGEADSGRIQPVTINQCQIGGAGGNPYSMDEMKQFAEKAGGAVTNISQVVTKHGDHGQTTEVVFSTNRGTVTLSGQEFKTIFNLRAPGYLRIPQNSFASFNIEHKL